MTPEQLRDYCLAKPGAWEDQPWEGDLVAKVGDKIFAFPGEIAQPRTSADVSLRGRTLLVAAGATGLMTGPSGSETGDGRARSPGLLIVERR
jgi:hypothetical protein